MELIQTALYPFYFTLTRLFDLVKNFSTSIQTPVSVSVCLTCGLCTVSEYEPSLLICKTVSHTVGQHQRKLPSSSSSFLFLETKPPRKSSAPAVYQTRRTILQNLLLLLFFHSGTLPKQYFVSYWQHVCSQYSEVASHSPQRAFHREESPGDLSSCSQPWRVCRVYGCSNQYVPCSAPANYISGKFYTPPSSSHPLELHVLI